MKVPLRRGEIADLMISHSNNATYRVEESYVFDCPPCAACRGRILFHVADMNAIANLVRSSTKDEEDTLKSTVRPNDQDTAIPQQDPLTSKYFDAALPIMKAKARMTPLTDMNSASGSNPSWLSMMVNTTA